MNNEPLDLAKIEINNHRKELELIDMRSDVNNGHQTIHAATIRV